MRHRAWPALLLLVFLLLLTSAGTLAQERGAPGSLSCQRALDALAAREAAAATNRSALGALEVARREAAVACLGGRDASASAPPRAAQPAVTTTLPLRPSAAGVPLPAPAAVPPPLPRPAAPLTVTACDPTGCWASDGSRLQRVGPNLLGPNGQACSTSGALLHCTR